MLAFSQGDTTIREHDQKGQHALCSFPITVHSSPQSWSIIHYPSHIMKRPIRLLVMQDALKFPLIGSAVLVGLFALFKFLPKDIVNAVLTAYFVLLGTFAVTAAMLPIIEGILPQNWQGQAFKLKGFTMPYLVKVSPNLQQKSGCA